MTEFSNERFVDIGQQIFIGSMKDLGSEQILRLIKEDEDKPGFLNKYFECMADYAFQAAEKFADTFRHIEE